MPSVDVLVPTCNRLPALIYSLSGLAGQDFNGYHMVLADQSDQPITETPVVNTLLRIIETRGNSVEYHHRVPSRGIAEQRHFLLDRASADYVLFLDDDIWMEPWVLGKMIELIAREGGGFVGAFGTGLSYRNDIRPDQQSIEYWEGPVQPEALTPEGPGWERWQLHRAANLFHISQSIPPGEVRLYKVAWVAACVLYDRRKSLEVGGFSFWDRLPRYHSGEEVVLQNLLMRRWGGCGMVPSGTYFAEMPSTVLNPKGSIDGHALDLLPELVERFVPQARHASP